MDARQRRFPETCRGEPLAPCPLRALAAQSSDIETIAFEGCMHVKRCGRSSAPLEVVHVGGACQTGSFHSREVGPGQRLRLSFSSSSRSSRTRRGGPRGSRHLGSPSPECRFRRLQSRFRSWRRQLDAGRLASPGGVAEAPRHVAPFGRCNTAIRLVHLRELAAR